MGPLTALDGSAVDITGGKVRHFSADSGSVVTISGGEFAGGFLAGGGSIAGPGSVLSISGGTFGTNFRATRSVVTFFGGEFLLNGEAAGNSTVSLSLSNNSRILTGTFEDGSPFVFSRSALDVFEVQLVNTAVPPPNAMPFFVDSSNAPKGLRSGEELTLLEGGLLGDNFAVVNATLNIEAGHAKDIEAVDSIVNVAGGTVGGRIDAYSGSTINILDGAVGGEGFSHLWANAGSVVNISGGVVDKQIVVENGSTVNITGGVIGKRFARLRAFSGSVVNISGGSIGSGFEVHSGSMANISGGTTGTGFQALVGNLASLSGGEFLLNGMAIGDSSISLEKADVLSGTLEDGSPFIFSYALDTIDIVSLVNTSVPPIDRAPLTVNSEVAPSGLRAGQILTLNSGGVLRSNFAAVGATLNIAGGEAVDIEVVDTRVKVSGGLIADRLMLHAGGVVNVSGGVITNILAYTGSLVDIAGGEVRSFTAHGGSQVSISGGTLGSDATAESGSEVDISGGAIGDRFMAAFGSLVNISGGTFGSGFTALSGTTTLHGGEFLLNGNPISSQTITLVGSDILTGTLEDGSPFVFSRVNGGFNEDVIVDLNLASGSLPHLDTAPISVDGIASLTGLRAGQTLTLQDGGVLGGDFAVVGSTLNIAGGATKRLELVGADVNISGGFVNGEIDAYTGSSVNITGGALAETLVANSGSSVRISGGRFEGDLRAHSGSAVSILGTEFLIDGEPVSNLTAGEPLIIADRRVVLSGTLIDGLEFSFFVTQNRNSTSDLFSAESLLTITLVETGLTGDYNNDGIVDAADYTKWRDNLGAPAGTLLNDVDGGIIGIAQYQTFANSFGTAALPTLMAVVPEPAALVLTVLCWGFSAARRYETSYRRHTR